MVFAKAALTVGITKSAPVVTGAAVRIVEVPPLTLKLPLIAVLVLMTVPPEVFTSDVIRVVGFVIPLITLKEPTLSSLLSTTIFTLSMSVTVVSAYAAADKLTASATADSLNVFCKFIYISVSYKKTGLP